MISLEVIQNVIKIKKFNVKETIAEKINQRRKHIDIESVSEEDQYIEKDEYVQRNKFVHQFKS